MLRCSQQWTIYITTSIGEVSLSQAEIRLILSFISCCQVTAALYRGMASPPRRRKCIFIGSSNAWAKSRMTVSIEVLVWIRSFCTVTLFQQNLHKYWANTGTANHILDSRLWERLLRFSQVSTLLQPPMSGQDYFDIRLWRGIERYCQTSQLWHCWYWCRAQMIADRVTLW